MFRLARPLSRPSPVVVEIPHAGTAIPPDLADSIVATATDIARDSDLYVDELYDDAPTLGAVMLVAQNSRYVVDLNRFEDDVDLRVVPDAPTARSGVERGVLWHETTDGAPLLRAPLSLAAFTQRLDRYYRPYHRALAAEIAALHERFGYVIVVSAHSMPSASRPVPGVRSVRRADVVPGTRGRSTAHPALIDAIDTHFRAAGLSVRHDDPYRGGATTVRWGRPEDGVHAIQIELNRALYMDEITLQRRPERMAWLRSICSGLIKRFASMELGSSSS
jgi:N-formylglutamate amidohydrolase